jgi:putative ABC transport system permease protein
VLLQVTVTFSNGFNMDKYLRHFVTSDYIVANSNYFNPVSTCSISEETAVSETTINDIKNQNSLIDSGRIYGISGYVNETVTEEWYRKMHGKLNNKETVNSMLQSEEHTADGKVTDNINLYGMEDFPQSLLTVIEGDLAPLSDPTQNAIVAVYQTDDYAQVEPDSHWAKVGDQITLRYIDSFEYYDTRTGELVTDTDKVAPEYLNSRVAQYHEVSYTVVALVTIPYAESYRYFGLDEFVLNSEVFKRDTGTSNIMTYLFNTSKESTTNMENFLANYTEKIDPTMDYESKQLYAKEFESLRNIFLLMGGVLSGIVGLVGILNFLNGVLTSILTRRREFAMLQSIGMTGRQLKTMLVCEGVLYTFFAISVSLILSIITGPLLNKAISSILWFFTYRFTLLPILIVAPIFLLMGIVIPLITYRFTTHQTIVERLREVE